MLFRLIGRKAVFCAVKRFDALGFIPCVTGRTLDGTQQTTARVADIVPIERVTIVITPAYPGPCSRRNGYTAFLRFDDNGMRETPRYFPSVERAIDGGYALAMELRTKVIAVEMQVIDIESL